LKLFFTPTSLCVFFPSAGKIHFVLRDMDVAKPFPLEQLFPKRWKLRLEQQEHQKKMTPLVQQPPAAEEKKEEPAEPAPAPAPGAIDDEDPFRFNCEFQSSELETAEPDLHFPEEEKTIEDGTKFVIDFHGLKPVGNLQERPLFSPSPKPVRPFPLRVVMLFS